MNATDPPPTIRLDVDRTQAMNRALWRIGGALVAVAPLRYIRPDWRLLWLTQPASCLALGLVLALIGVAAVILGLVSLRWLLLVIWPASTHITIDPDHVRLRLGPFGSADYTWAQLRVRLPPDFDAELFDTIPDEAFLPEITASDRADDLVARIQRFANLSPERLTGLLRPYVRRALDRATGGASLG